MSEYYVGAFSFNDNYAISHGRTKGSKNGISTTKGYTAIGQRAQGRRDPRTGYYIYDTGFGAKPSNYMQRARVNRAVRTTTAYAKNAGRQVGRSATSAYNSASRAVGNAYGSASRYASSAYSNARRAVGNAYGSASRYASSAYSNARRAVGKAYDNGREFLTGSKARSAMADARRKSRNAHRFNQITSDWYGETGAQAHRTGANMQRIASSEAAYARRQYEKTLPGRLERFGKNVSSFATASYSKAKSWLSTAGKKATAAVSSAKSTLKKYGSMAISSIKTTASSTAGKVKNFLSGIFGKKKKKRNSGNMVYNTRTREGMIGTGGRVGTAHGPHKRWD